MLFRTICRVEAVGYISVISLISSLRLKLALQELCEPRGERNRAGLEPRANARLRRVITERIAPTLPLLCIKLALAMLVVEILSGGKQIRTMG